MIEYRVGDRIVKVEPWGYGFHAKREGVIEEIVGARIRVRWLSQNGQPIAENKEGRTPRSWLNKKSRGITICNN